MKINIHNTFDPLKEVIVGKPDLSVLDSVEDTRKKSILETVLTETIEDLDCIQQVLEKFGVTVLRPVCNVNFSKLCATPYFDIAGHRVPLSPRDIFLCYDDTIVITAQADRNRYFESLSYNQILKRYLDNDSHVVSMPMPALDDNFYENINEDFAYYNNDFPAVSAANFLKYGRDIFYSNFLSANPSGIDWIKRQMGKDYQFHPMPTQYQGHLDAFISILKPGVLTSSIDKKYLPEYFKNWTVIESKTAIANNNQLISEHVQDDDFENSVSCTNAISIDQEHALVFEDTPAEVLRGIEKCSINTVPVKLRHNNFLNQALSCVILDTVREGKLEKYS